MTSKSRSRRVQKTRTSRKTRSLSSRIAWGRIIATAIVLGVIVSIVVADKIPLIGASCNVPEPIPTKNIVKRGSELTSEDSTRSIIAFRSQIQSLIDQSGINQNSKISIRIMSSQQNEIFYEKNPDQYLTPASTTKLFPTFAAYALLGADYMVPTRVCTNAPIENGIVKGDVYLKGYGDPTLSVQDIKDLVREIAKKGITAIEGNIYADATYFDDITERHIYSGDNEIVEPLAPITALGMNRNGFAVEVRSGEVSIIPQSDGISLSRSGLSSKAPVIAKKSTKAEVKGKKSSKKKEVAKHSKKKSKAAKSKKSEKKKSTKEKKKGKKRAFLDPYLIELSTYVGDVPKAPKSRKGKKARVSISTSGSTNGMQVVSVSGRGSATSYLTMKYPDMFVAGVLKHQLKLAGISVKGIIARKVMPENAEIIGEFKHPLSYLIGLVNKNSDNFLAEHVYKLVGASAGGQKNTGKVATETVKRVLSDNGIPVDGICIYDGSGLCRKNLFSAAVQTMLLNRALKLPFGQDFKNSLSVAGVDGTLRKRMSGTYAASNLRAKTGTLSNTSALSGYSYTKDGEQLIFSIILNGPSVGEYKQLENRIGEAIANFSYALPLKGSQ